MSLKNQIHRAFRALAHANAGEMLPDEQKLAVLGLRNIAISLAAVRAAAGADYAVEICRRLNANLILLTPEEPSSDDELDGLRARLARERIGLNAVGVKGEWVEGVCHFVREHRNVILVVLSPHDLEAASRAREPARMPKWALAVPMVVVDHPPQPAG